MSRLTTAYMSKYQRTRRHYSVHELGEVFRLRARYASLGEGTFSSVSWSQVNGSGLALSSPSGDDTASVVTCEATLSGDHVIRAEVVFSSGVKAVQLFRVRVLYSSTDDANAVTYEAG